MSSFSFNPPNLEQAEKILAKYPKEHKRSAVLPLLDLAQRQRGGWLCTSALEYVASFLQMPYVKIIEIASFYSMFNLKPVGKYHVQICTTTPCWLRGSDSIVAEFENILQIKIGQTTQDNLFTLSEVACLGACIKAPVVQIQDQYYESPLDPLAIITELKKQN